MAEVKAQLNNLRISPRKVRAIAGLIRGKNVNDAVNQLGHFVRRSSLPIKKLIDSAIANAENNFNMIRDNLYVKSIIVDEGVKLKRMRAKGFGRAASIQKKTSHIKIILDEHTPGLKREKTIRSKEDNHEDEIKETRINQAKKPEIKREIGSKGLLSNIGKKIFQRKSI